MQQPHLTYVKNAFEIRTQKAASSCHGMQIRLAGAMWFLSRIPTMESRDSLTAKTSSMMQDGVLLGLQWIGR